MTYYMLLMFYHFIGAFHNFYVLHNPRNLISKFSIKKLLYRSYLETCKEILIRRGGDRVSVHFAVRFLDCWRTFCMIGTDQNGKSERFYSYVRIPQARNQNSDREKFSSWVHYSYNCRLLYWKWGMIKLVLKIELICCVIVSIE